MSHPSPLRFFWATARPGYVVVSAAGLVVSGAAWSALRDPDDFDQFCVLALFFQMFSASSGFRHQALRGHFDPILTAGQSRSACARALWALAILPGMVVWLVIASLAWAFQPGRAPALMSMTSASGLVAVLYASTLSWTVSLPLRRYSGGMIWLAVIFGLAAGHQLHSLRESFLMSSGRWGDTLAVTGAALVTPVFLVANPEVAGAASLGLVLSVTAVAWMAGAGFIAWFDGVLEDPS
jgi:hypothetical protein